jgi:LmeA-like phospholipid-binding
MITKSGSDIISKVLSPAICLWLRSQVEEIETLDLKISGGDRQILRGYIPQVSFATNKAIYQGIHLKQIELQAENIKINLGQILRGKPLRLLEPVPVSGQLLLDEVDLQASVISPLLSSGLTELVFALLEKSGIETPETELKSYQIKWENIEIHQEKFSLSGNLTDSNNNSKPLNIYSGLTLINPQKLHLNPIIIEGLPDHLEIKINELEIDLGDHVEIKELNLIKGQLSCMGQLIVQS